MIKNMRRAIGVMAVLAVVTIGGFALGWADRPDMTASGCLEGYTSWVSFGEFAAGPAPATREDAIRAELEPRTASDEAIADALANFDSGGEDLVRVRANDGVVVTVTLVPQNPGWRTEGSSWCAPDEG